jgi:hypothetical protein
MAAVLGNSGWKWLIAPAKANSRREIILESQFNYLFNKINSRIQKACVRRTTAAF